MDRPKADDEVDLLKHRYSQDSVERAESSSDLDRRHYAQAQQQHLSQSRRLQAVRIGLDLVVLACLGVALYFLVQIQVQTAHAGGHSDSSSSSFTAGSVMHRAPAGSDLSGVVPLGEVGGRTKYKSWMPRKGLWATPHDFREATALNGTLDAWKRVIKPFVKADDSWDHRGPEIPLIYDLFEVSAFHQVHCLAGILEDFSYMAMGIPQAQLPSVTRLERLDWAEHNAHCFNYVLEAIMCFADTTTEGATPGNPPAVHKEATHVCNDWDALFEWSEKPEHRMPEVDGLRAVN